MRWFFVAALFAIVIASAEAQVKDERAVEAVISALFNGMEKGDSAMVHGTFKKDILFVSIFCDRNNVPGFSKETSPQDFLNAIGMPHQLAWHEEIWDLSIQIDGDFAQAWCNYAFYLGDKFSHCGVDAFQLYRDHDHWKIFQLTDTRRKESCTIPAAIRQKHE